MHYVIIIIIIIIIIVVVAISSCQAKHGFPDAQTAGTLKYLEAKLFLRFLFYKYMYNNNFSIIRI
jgi:hypothetical protein